MQLKRMCDETVNDSLASLKLTSDWFVTSKLYTSILMKILMKLYFLVMKWVLVV